MTGTFVFPEVVEGESLDMRTRLVVAPVAGTFEPIDGVVSEVLAGQVVGHVVNASDRVAITSPFGGAIVSMLAWPKERVRKYQNLIALDAVAHGAA